MSRSLPDRLRLPVIVAPMTRVSGPELVVACCRSGIVGAFPTHNAATTGELGRWLDRTAAALAEAADPAPWAVNLVVHPANPRRDDDLRCLLDHRPDLVILSVGPPEEAIDSLAATGARVLVSVATLRHVVRARDAGADGVVLLSSGAGGQTGDLNPFAFLRAARSVYDGLLILAGGIADGRSIAAARMAGADLVCMGTRFIATRESLADEAYRWALAAASIDDITTTDALTGLPANVLRAWLDHEYDAARGDGLGGLDRAPQVWAAGHGVGAVTGVTTVGEVVDQLALELQDASVPEARPRPDGARGQPMNRKDRESCGERSHESSTRPAVTTAIGSRSSMARES